VEQLKGASLVRLTSWKGLPGTNTSLLRAFANCGHKKFYIIGPRAFGGGDYGANENKKVSETRSLVCKMQILQQYSEKSVWLINLLFSAS